jgi:hypothetical protein
MTFISLIILTINRPNRNANFSCAGNYFKILHHYPHIILNLDEAQIMVEYGAQWQR